MGQGKSKSELIGSSERKLKPIKEVVEIEEGTYIQMVLNSEREYVPVIITASHTGFSKWVKMYEAVSKNQHKLLKYFIKKVEYSSELKDFVIIGDVAYESESDQDEEDEEEEEDEESETSGEYEESQSSKVVSDVAFRPKIVIPLPEKYESSRRDSKKSDDEEVSLITFPFSPFDTDLEKGSDEVRGDVRNAKKRSRNKTNSSPSTIQVKGLIDETEPTTINSTLSSGRLGVSNKNVSIVYDISLIPLYQMYLFQREKFLSGLVGMKQMISHIAANESRLNGNALFSKVTLNYNDQDDKFIKIDTIRGSDTVYVPYTLFDIELLKYESTLEEQQRKHEAQLMGINYLKSLKQRTDLPPDVKKSLTDLLEQMSFK
jgi:hypothetical protein